MSETFALLKPDAIERGLVGEILQRVELAGFQIVEIKTVQATEDKLREHYAHIADKPFFPSVVDYMTRKPVIALILEAPNAVNKWRKLMGSTNPDDAVLGSIRGDYGVSPTETVENLVHGSDSEDNVEKEKRIWMK